MGLGWVVFEKSYEDDCCIEYKYSHDSYAMDGTIRIKKEPSHCIETDSIFNRFSIEEKDEIFRVVFEELDEEPKVNKELWEEYSKRIDENERLYAEWLHKSIVEVMLSKTDLDKGFFAYKVIHFVYGICCGYTWDFPDKYILAFG